MLQPFVDALAAYAGAAATYVGGSTKIFYKPHNQNCPESLVCVFLEYKLGYNSLLILQQDN